MNGFSLSTRQGSVALSAPVKRAEEIGGHPLSDPIQVSYGLDLAQGVDGLASKNVAGIFRIGFNQKTTGVGRERRLDFGRHGGTVRM